jgi:hypothetical protein
MADRFKQIFEDKWRSYFGAAEWPVAYYYTDKPMADDLQESHHITRCLIGNLNRVRQGYAYVYNLETPGCTGGKRYTGTSDNMRPDIEFFLSCGIPGKQESERYKKDPELTKIYLEKHPAFEAPAANLVFKRWDKMRDDEIPFAAVFFATPDVLAGLFTLANYDWADSDAVIAPMGSGCASIISYAFEESKKPQQRCILGMFDVSARPFVPSATLTFTVPLKRLRQLVGNMDSSFLITSSWEKVRQRITP